MNTVDRESFVIKKLMRDACTRFKHTKYITIENASYRKIMASEFCNGVDTCFLIIPNGIFKVLKTSTAKMDYLIQSTGFPFCMLPCGSLHT